ncbi:putative helicase 22 [Dissostichus eleginoides]|nr:putative helicase 22 [Dissostichus eleginoides]
MPRKLWQVKLTCPHPECNKELLSSAGLHQKIRQVVAVGKMYFVASESLACRRCKRTLISWSHDLVSQLDIGHRVQFPCILTSKLACDAEVASLMRQRGMVSSSIQIQRKLQERHDEVWMQKTVQYLQDCKASAVTWGRILPGPFEPAPAMPPVPKHRG